MATIPKKFNNISRNLPKVTNTGNTLLNVWLSAADEIIKDLRQRLVVIEKLALNQKQVVTSSVKNINDESVEHELISNKINNISDQSNDEQYPSAKAVYKYVNLLIDDLDADAEDWEIETQAFESLDVRVRDKLKIIGTGTFKGQKLNDSDVVEVYKDNDGSLNVIKIRDSQALYKGSSSDELQEGITNLFFSEERVLNTILAGFALNTGNVSSTDTALIALGKIQFQLNQLESTIQSINDNYVHKSEILPSLNTTAPSTGTYTLKVTDGVVSWE